jgi:hypothetical protein
VVDLSTERFQDELNNLFSWVIIVLFDYFYKSEEKEHWLFYIRATNHGFGVSDQFLPFHAERLKFQSHKTLFSGNNFCRGLLQFGCDLTPKRLMDWRLDS